jgi:hypothetical protein
MSECVFIMSSKKVWHFIGVPVNGQLRELLLLLVFVRKTAGTNQWLSNHNTVWCAETNSKEITTTSLPIINMVRQYGLPCVKES